MEILESPWRRSNSTTYFEFDHCDYQKQVDVNEILKFIINVVIWGLMSLFGIFGNLLTMKIIDNKETSTQAKAFHIFMKILCINDAILMVDSLVVVSLPLIEE